MVEKTQQQEVAAKASVDAAKAADEARKVAAAGVDERLKVKERQVQESQERQDALQPTPTQRENDLARVGALNIDEKEDDGSEWEDEHVNRVQTEKLNNPYNTRDLSAPDAGRTRRGGRGRKSK